MSEFESLHVFRCGDNFDFSDLSSANWASSKSIIVGEYWDTRNAPDSRHFSTQLLWTDASILVRFDANQTGSPVLSDTPILDSKTKGLWERDVCEIFIAPYRSEPRRYFEFEIAPTGEWLDVAIDSTSGERVTDWEYASGMETAACIEENRVVMAMKIPWEALGRKPEPGDIWLGNIFRCVGKEPDRGYLAWQPTMTELPNFHVPEAFGEFVFVSEPAA